VTVRVDKAVCVLDPRVLVVWVKLGLTLTVRIEVRVTVVDDVVVFETDIDPVIVVDPVELLDFSELKELVRDTLGVIEAIGLRVLVTVDDNDDDSDSMAVEEDDRVYDEDLDAIYVSSGIEVNVWLTLTLRVGDRVIKAVLVDDPVIVIDFDMYTVPDTVTEAVGVLLCLDVYDWVTLDVIVLLDDIEFVFIALPVIVLESLEVNVAVLETLDEAELLGDPDTVLLEAIVRLEVEDAVADLETKGVEVPLGDIRDVREIAGLLDWEGEPVAVFEPLIDTDDVPLTVDVLDFAGEWVILGDPDEVFVVDIEEVVVLVFFIDLVIKAELVCVFDAIIVFDLYGDDVLVFDGAPEDVGARVIKGDNVTKAVFVARRDGGTDCVRPLVRVEVLLDVGLSVGITNPSRSMRLLYI
jgi:hypothetical protein